MSNDVPVLESIKQTCFRWDVSRSQVYRDMGAGKLEAVKRARRISVVFASAKALYGDAPKARIKPDKRQKQPAAEAGAA